MARILVINPNSTEAVTEAMDRALDPLRLTPSVTIDCVTMHDGPPGVETQAHVDDVTRRMLPLVAAEEATTDAFVIACFSDPGIHAVREASTTPVFGIAECAYNTALSLGDRFGVMAILDRSIPRHMRFLKGLGLAERLAGERALGLSVVELSDEGKTYHRMVDVAEALRDQDGAKAIIMGCAGMAKYRERLQDDIGIAVIDPTQAATATALMAIAVGYRPKAKVALAAE